MASKFSQSTLSFNPPQDLRQLTPEQNEEIVKWFMSLPLKELRQRQALCVEQQKLAWNQLQNHGTNSSAEMGMANLDITWGQLWRAISRKVFGDD